MLKNLIGRNVKATVVDENNEYVFSQIDGFTFKTAKMELKTVPKKGGEISGFAYENEKHELQITKNGPKTVGINRFGWAKVVKVAKSLGVFVDIGLKNKDLAVSLDILPEMKNLWPNVGDRLMVAIEVDEKGRMWGVLANEDIFRDVSIRATPKMMNQDIFATVYRLKIVGTYVITNDYNLGFIHPTERYTEPRLGEILKARVINVREDGILNLSLRPRAYEAISEDALMILEVLKHSDGIINFTDKSSPDEIKDHFGISKGQFKRSLGHLMKAGLIRQENGKTILLEKK